MRRLGDKVHHNTESLEMDMEIMDLFIREKYLFLCHAHAAVIYK